VTTPRRALGPDERLLALALFAMVVLNFAGVVARYWLRISLPWIEEIEVGLFVWTVFLGAGLTVVRDLHLGFSALADQLPARAQAVVALAGRGLFFGFFTLLAWFGTRMVLNEVANDQRTPTLGWPEWLIGAAVPVGALLAAARILTAPGRRGAS
jgi:TRAP-type C4-dicarboxylate transport system permease small subunit